MICSAYYLSPGTDACLGMKTSLENYQLLGAAFLRGRENASKKPRGGILSDEMGLGYVTRPPPTSSESTDNSRKTVMMICNLIDGKSLNQSQRTTLIVVPSSLTGQWLREIDKHATRDAIRDVIVYRSASQSQSNDPQSQVRALAINDIVVTSYNEVLKSMPKKSTAPTSRYRRGQAKLVATGMGNESWSPTPDEIPQDRS
jgi:SNF2 family DNA or RNA helicase